MNTILALGVILASALAAGKVVSRFKIPFISAYIVLGILFGPHVLGLAGEGLLAASDLFFNIVLGIIAFHLGINFSLENFRRIGRAVIFISITAAFVPWLFVTMGICYIAKEPFYIALIYGAISAATAPAATMMVVREYRARGPFTDRLLGIVAIDDAWGIMVFSISLSIAQALEGHLPEAGILFVTTKAGGQILLCVVLGSLIALLVSRVSANVTRKGDVLTLILGAVLINTGAALFFHISPLLSNMFFGAVLVNIDKTAFRFFDSLKSIDWPLYIIFYVLAGANLDMGLLKTLGLIASVYIIFRVAGKMAGAYIGGVISGTEKQIRNYMGFALIPQAGVALGLALLARANFPEIGEAVFATIAATTILYEIFGPIATRYALSKAGDIGKGDSGAGG